MAEYDWQYEEKYVRPRAPYGKFEWGVIIGFALAGLLAGGADTAFGAAYFGWWLADIG